MFSLCADNACSKNERTGIKSNSSHEKPLDFIGLFLCVFFKYLELFDEVYHSSFQFCVLGSSR